jgi:hypothetical protein
MRQTFIAKRKLPNLPFIQYLQAISLEILGYLCQEISPQLEHGENPDPVPLAKEFLREKFGYRYLDGIKELRNLQIIRPVLYDLPDGSQAEFSQEHHLCRQYSLSFECLQALRKRQFIRQEVRIDIVLPKVSRAKRRIENGKGLSKSEKKKIKKNFKGLTIRQEWVKVFRNPEKIPSEGKLLGLERALKRLRSGYITASKSEKTGRIFQTVLSLPKEMRPFLRLGHEDLCEIDATSFHPYLLALFLPEEKRNSYLQFLDGLHRKKSSIYEEFDEVKARAKVDFQRFLAGSQWGKGPRKIRSWFAESYPEIIEKIDSFKKDSSNGTFQCQLQRLEASIFITEIFATAPFWMLPLHDGILVRKADFDAAHQFCQDAIFEKLGYHIPLKPEKPPTEASKAQELPLAA